MPAAQCNQPGAARHFASLPSWPKDVGGVTPPTRFADALSPAGTQITTTTRYESLSQSKFSTQPWLLECCLPHCPAARSMKDRPSKPARGSTTRSSTPETRWKRLVAASRTRQHQTTSRSARRRVANGRDEGTRPAEDLFGGRREQRPTADRGDAFPSQHFASPRGTLRHTKTGDGSLRHGSSHQQQES